MLRFVTMAGTVFWLTLSLTAQQTDNSAPAQPQSQSSSSDQQKKQDKKKPADNQNQNAFPEAQSEKAAQGQNQQDPSEPSAPEPAKKDQAAPEKKPSAAEQNPFPEAESEKAAHQQQQQAPAASDADGDQNYSSSQVHLKGLDLAPDTDSAPVVQASSPLPYDPKLAKKDAQVGDFYLETGDFRGAYERFVEAARSDPGNPEAVWGLAESARHLQMNDVAIKNFRLYLAALPNGPHAKEIRKVLHDMGL